MKFGLRNLRACHAEKNAALPRDVLACMLDLFNGLPGPPATAASA
ncbi:MAG: hypothetical protein ACQEUZ_02290 [Pseudomonadota bacterium]